MKISTLIAGIIAIIVGILILIFPKILNYAIAVYLLLFGTLLITSSLTKGITT